MAFRRLVIVAAWIAVVAAGPAPVRLPDAAERAFDAVSADVLRGWVETLASDAFAGRGVGDEGNREAEEYIADVLRESGVPGGAVNGAYFEPVELYEPGLGRSARLTAVDDRGNRVCDLQAGADFYPLPETGDAAVSAPLVRAGFGISAPGARYDDYSHVDARGAVVLVREGEPDKLGLSRRVTREESLELSTVDRKIADARRHGARGLLLVRSVLPDAQTAWPEHPSVRSSMFRLLASLRDASLPAGAISEKAAAPLHAALAARRRLTVTLVPDLMVRRVTVHNVLGVIEGKDPQRRREVVVLGAHLDHDGTDADGRIYNGADDNASGTAAVLGAAAAFARAAQAGDRPARTVLFALWNGEEKGELGAYGFLADPRPDRRLVANINLDMVGRHEDVPDEDDWRFRGFRKTTPESSANTLHVLGYSRTPDLAAEMREANGPVGLTLLEDYDVGAQDLLERSDNWPFLERGVPALFLTTGLHPDYHTPDDDTARIDFAKLERVARLAARAAWIVADGPEPRLKSPIH